MNECEHHNNGFWLGFFIGGLLGAVVIFLLATKDGRRLAKEILNWSEDLADSLEEKKEKVEEEVKEVKDNVEGQVMEKIDDALLKLEEKQDEAREATSDFRKRFFSKNGKKLA